jgi:adenine deaminase
MKSRIQKLLDAARGRTSADAVFRNTRIFNPFTCTWEEGCLAVKDGLVLGIGDYAGKKEYDLAGLSIVPGLIDAHTHIESSLLAPREYARLAAMHGTTTVVADPHEIANVAGGEGLKFMLAESCGADIDILYMLPSCVPATPLDAGGAVLEAADLAPFTGFRGVIGLGEMMNVPGVLEGDPAIQEKLALFTIRDGHAPLLSGKELNAYILAGLQSDHECTTRAEACEKLKKGMYIFIREGSAEQNIEELIPIVTPATVSRCCFATDDCHADLLVREGHIDRCIRKAVACGIAPELAIRMATLSAAERFGLADRGALVPGRRADFCVIDNPNRFIVHQVFRSGTPLIQGAFREPAALPVSFRCRIPPAEEIAIEGSGIARVIGLVPHQIITKSLTRVVSGKDVPDLSRDILKVVVCNRYGNDAVGVGIVHGFGFERGAVASSISHDAHNLVAVGTGDAAILSAIGEVIRQGGAMAAVIGQEKAVLPLTCAGLMSTLPYPLVAEQQEKLTEMTGRMGGIPDPFMYLSFLSLTVIPALRITDRGMFDTELFRDVPLFVREG